MGGFMVGPAVFDKSLSLCADDEQQGFLIYHYGDMTHVLIVQNLLKWIWPECLPLQLQSHNHVLTVLGVPCCQLHNKGKMSTEKRGIVICVNSKCM